MAVVTASSPIRCVDNKMPFLNRRCGAYKALDCIGAGCFGAVWSGIDSNTNTEVAMKFAVEKEDKKLLELEVSILSRLDPTEQQGIPQFLHFGFHFDTKSAFACMVMEKLGATAGDYMRSYSKRNRWFGCQTSILIAQQLLQRLEYLHSKGFVHSDLKPENIMFGTGRKVHHVYLIDFGLSKAYWKPAGGKAGAHIPMNTYARVAGTPRYTSTHGHKGLESGRRDDLESAGYVLLHMIKTSLPWSSFDTRSPGYMAQVKALKLHMPLDTLCEGAPKPFKAYMASVLKLGFTEKPDYAMLHDCIDECRAPHTKDHHLEWLDDVEPAELEPLLPRSAISQPEDQAPCPNTAEKKSSGGYKFFPNLFANAMRRLKPTTPPSTPPRGALRQIVPQ